MSHLASQRLGRLATVQPAGTLQNNPVGFYIASVDPWRVRCLEIRGRAEAIADATDSAVPFPSAIICVHPRPIISFGIDPPATSRGKRNVN